MGTCFSVNKAPRSPAKAEKSPAVRTVDEFNVHKSDFIVHNTGKFKELYSIGKLIGTGGLGEVRKC